MNAWLENQKKDEVLAETIGTIVPHRRRSLYTSSLTGWVDFDTVLACKQQLLGIILNEESLNPGKRKSSINEQSISSL